jgi:hypothetical protein
MTEKRKETTAFELKKQKKYIVEYFSYINEKKEQKGDVALS